MTGLRRFLLLSVLVALTGCETLDGAYTGVREKFASLTAREPSQVPDSAEGAKDAEDAAPLIAAHGVDCPRVGVVDDLNSLTQFVGEGGNVKDSSIISSARVANIQSQCSINDTNVIVDMDIQFDGRLGPQGKVKPDDKPSFSYPYFIAITTPSGSITAKEVFAAAVTYDDGKDSKVHAEQMRQVIPLTAEYNPKDYEILVGFQLSAAELAYNRANPAAASTVRNLPPAPGAAAAPIDDVSAEAAPPAMMPEPDAPAPAPAEAYIPAPPPAENDIMDVTATPQPVAEVPAAPQPVAEAPAVPGPVYTETPQPQAEDVKPLEQPVAVAPLYPPAVGQAPPPPVAAPSKQKIIPRIDMSY